ncbi:MAG TPA: HAMP domain-containing sensor histidine kinase [Rhizomicrobium sp.]|nr:HAMP domain-containing sensor histidine kinase [Rhizomicrobium sp.]
MRNRDRKALFGHLLTIVNDHRDIARADAGQLRLDEEEIDLANLVMQTGRFIFDQATKAGLEFSIRTDEQLPGFRGDSIKLRQILLNLLGNAIKFTPAGGQVLLSVNRSAEGGVLIKVSDTGTGIPRDKLELALSLFGPIYSKSPRKFKGIGLAFRSRSGWSNCMAAS